MINGDYGAIERDMDVYDLGIRSTIVMERFLMDGFTAVRDMGGRLLPCRKISTPG